MDAKISEYVLEKSEKQFKFESTVFLKERGILRHLIKNGEIEEARIFLHANFNQLLENNVKLQAYMDILDFISCISSGELVKAIETTS